MPGRTLILICFFLFASKSILSQPVVFGSNNYIEYQIGTLPIVISVPHGGAIEPASIPDRLCNNPVYATDAFTIETAMEIKHALYARTGCYPHIIVCHLMRSKLDCNRNKTDGACGNIDAETAWTEYHNFITAARNTASEQFNKNTFFIDLHGHGNAIQRIELGYLLYDYELELSDNVLNTEQYLNYSSIKNLVTSNINGYTHAQLLRGFFSLGTLLSGQNFPAVPSTSIPFPGTDNNYFSGGYTIANHTSYAPGIEMNGVQMELNYTGIRNSSANRIKFAGAFSDAIIDYLNTHFNMNWNFCSPNLINEMGDGEPDSYIYPNPLVNGNAIKINNLSSGHLCFELFTISGVKQKEGKLDDLQSQCITNDLDSGIYLIKIFNNQTSYIKFFKLIIE